MLLFPFQKLFQFLFVGGSYPVGPAITQRTEMCLCTILVLQTEGNYLKLKLTYCTDNFTVTRLGSEQLSDTFFCKLLYALLQLFCA
ncbi:hypothetical protein D3C85_1578480 [compost metagenome]